MTNTKSFQERRAEMKAKIAAQTDAAIAELRNIYDGKCIRNGRYEFVVMSEREGFTTIAVNFNGKSFRSVRYIKSLNAFASNTAKPLTTSLLTALCEEFVIPGEGYGASLTRRRNSWHNSVRYAESIEHATARALKHKDCPFLFPWE